MLKLKLIKFEANLCILASALSVSCNFSISFTHRLLFHDLFFCYSIVSEFDKPQNNSHQGTSTYVGTHDLIFLLEKQTRAMFFKTRGEEK